MKIKSNLNYNDYEDLKQYYNIEYDRPLYKDIRFNIENVAVQGKIYCRSVALSPIEIPKYKYIYVIDISITDTSDIIKRLHELLTSPVEVIIDRIRYYEGEHKITITKKDDLFEYDLRLISYEIF